MHSDYAPTNSLPLANQCRLALPSPFHHLTAPVLRPARGRELEERERLADRTQMEHERRLVAVGEQAQQAVRETFDKLQQQLDQQQQRITEVSTATVTALGN